MGVNDTAAAWPACWVYGDVRSSRFANSAYVRYALRQRPSMAFHIVLGHRSLLLHEIKARQ